MTAKSRISSLRNRLYPYRSILFVLFIIVIFYNSWIELLDKYVVPIVNQIPNNNFIIAGCFFLFSTLVCCFNYKQLYKVNYLISQTLLVIVSVLGIYLYMKHYSHYNFYGYNNIDYVLISITPFSLAEIQRIVKVCKEKKQKRSVNDILPNSSFFIDTPCEDACLVEERKTYAKYLIQFIFGTFNSYGKEYSQSNPFINRGSFVINLGEEYGYGKTSFFALMHNKLTEKWTNQYISFCYQPWLCESESAMVTELFNRLREELSQYAPQINKNIADYIRTLLDKSDNLIVHFFRTTFCQSSSMYEERDRLKKEIVKIGKPIIIFIDDVDRLQKKELLTLLNLVRDTADFQNVFYIMAADKVHLTNCLGDCGISNPDMYLKKIINYEFMLPANDGFVKTFLQKELTTILSKYINDKSSFNKREGKLNEVVCSIVNHKNISSIFSNVRDVKRILNDYRITLTIVKSGFEDEIDYKDLFLLTIIKALRPDIYKVLRDYEDQLLYLSNDIYILNSKYINVHNDNEDLIETVREAKDVVNGKTGINDSAKKKKYETFDDMMINFKKTNDKFVADSLRCLFAPQMAKGDEIRLQYKESYYRYFSGQLKKNQLSNLEVEVILNNNEENFLKNIKDVISSNKTNSFIARMNYWSEKWTKSQFEFVKKIFLFIEEYRQSLMISPKIMGISSISIGKTIFKDIQYSQMLYNLYKTNPNHAIDDVEKEMLHDFLKENDHYDFSATTLNALHECLYFDLSIRYEELLLWRKELVCQFIREYFGDSPFSLKDEVLDVIPLLRGSLAEGPWDYEFANYLSNTPNFMSWFENMVIYKKGNFSWNDKYMEQLNFRFIGNFEDLISCCKAHIQQDERIKDLMKLIRFPSLESVDEEVHPFLLYVRKKYEFEE